MQIGDNIRVLEPFNIAFPDVYIIEDYHVTNNTFVICGDREFEAQFLEVV